MVGLVGLARLTDHMDLVYANADLLAMVAGIAGLSLTFQDTQRGVTRFGHHGYWEVRRDEHPVWFRVVTAVYVLGFVILLVGGRWRIGWGRGRRERAAPVPRHGLHGRDRFQPPDRRRAALKRWTSGGGECTMPPRV